MYDSNAKKQESCAAWYTNDRFCAYGAVVVCSAYGGCIFLGDGGVCVGVSFFHFGKMAKNIIYGAITMFGGNVCASIIPVTTNSGGVNNVSAIYSLYDT